MPLYCKVCRTRQANFNYEYETKAEYCKKCSEPEMIDVKHLKCKVCKVKHASFNYEYETK